MKETVERELKLSAEEGFQLPGLPGEPLPERTLTSTYYDTPDWRLAGAGITLRRRVENRKGVWQLKLPREEGRLELEVPGGPRTPPAEIVELLPAYVRGNPLGQVATLRTKRSGQRVATGDGTVADVTLDSVAVYDDGRSVRSFQELEVELVQGDAKGLRRIARTLRAAGATDGDGRPKLFQALDRPASPPGQPPAPDAPPAEHLGAMVEAQYRALLAHDPGTRLGRDPEELHQMRVATRRARALLRAARPLLDREWAASLRTELGWLGGALGPVRDLDVLIDHLRADSAGLEPRERRALHRVFRRLERERESARAAMLEALRGDRYAALLDRLEEAARAPRLAPGVETSLRELAAAEFRRLRRAARALEPQPADDELHELRIRGKRARYAAELAEGAAGKPATRFIREAKRFQDVLGEHQDAVVAEERLRGLLRELGGAATAFAVGRLVERQQARRAAARAAFPAAWRALERRGREAWG